MQTLHLYNSLTNEKEEFKSIIPKHIGMYVCGPTLYSEVHLGNLRTFISFDTIYRYLLHLGYKVRYVRNITDVGHLENDADHGEDKIAKQARIEKLEPMEVVQKYTLGFRELQRIFNLLPPSIEPQATGHIPEQIALTAMLIDKGLAYEVNGSVYMRVRKYNETHPYGELSGRKIDELLNETRDLDGMGEKEDFLDFALWKKASTEHIMKWDSPWGEGFPGWHLECTAMSKKYLGDTFDIHGGGMDLKFPHHECEIAQSKGSTNKAPANYWLHSNMLTTDGVKMSKSKGNSFLPMELVAGNNSFSQKGYSPMVIRFFMMQTHYRSTLDFSVDALDAAEKGYKRLMNAWENATKIETKTTTETELSKELTELCKQAFNCLNDDFNTAMSLANLFEICSKINGLKEGNIAIENVNIEAISLVRLTFNQIINAVMGIENEKSTSSSNVDGLMNLIIELRKEARDKKDFSTSDKIRDQLKESGYQIKDGKDGVSWDIV
jgi:cysteinyl-tRNA synthetase